MSQNQRENLGDYHRAKTWEIALFSLNNAATNLYIFAFGFLTYYATGIAGLATLLVSNVLGAARLFDGIIDPIIGVIMDRFETRWGKYRPLMLFANIGLVLSFLMIFNIHQLSGGIQIFAFFLSLIFHKIVYSFQQTVTKAAQPALTNDPKQRPLFSVFDTIFSSIGVLTLMQVVVSNWLVPRNGGDFTPEFFQEFLLLITSLSAVLTVLAIIGIWRKDNKEFFGLGENTVETKSLKDYWSVIKGNTPLQVLAISGGIVKFIVQFIGDQAFLVMLFGIILGNYALSGQLAIWLVIPNLIVVLIFTRIAGNQGLKSTYRYSIAISLISTIILFITLMVAEDPTQIFVSGGLAALLIIIGYIGMKAAATYPSSIVLTMAADISDYETARSGRFVSGLIGTVFSLTDSIASSLSPIIIGFIVAGMGYTDGYPSIDEALTPTLFRGGMLMIGLIIVLLAVVLFLISKYPLDGEAMAKVQATIAAKRAEGKLDPEEDPAQDA
jgi:Na+/melibiose symporter-like transporter